MIAYRTMRVEDIPLGLSLCRSARWNQLDRDWQLFLNLSPDGCIVAVDEEGQVVGTVTTIRYENNFSWIGMVLVDPARQRQGIGMQLLREALQILGSEETIKLDATPAGRQVYRKLNFVDEYHLSRMHIHKAPSNLPASSARPVHQRDIAAIIAFDRKIFGADRAAVLEYMMKGSPEYAFVLKEENQINGYCLGRSGYNFVHIGPVVSKSAEDAIQLASAAFRSCAGHPVIFDVLHHTPEWIEWLSKIGFTVQRPFIRMYKGSNAYPGIPEKQFAILGPEFG